MSGGLVGKMLQNRYDDIQKGPVNLYFIQAVNADGFDQDLMVRARSVDQALIDYHQVYFGVMEDGQSRHDIVLTPSIATANAALEKGYGLVSMIKQTGEGPILWHDPDFMTFQRAFRVVEVDEV